MKLTQKQEEFVKNDILRQEELIDIYRTNKTLNTSLLMNAVMFGHEKRNLNIFPEDKTGSLRPEYHKFYKDNAEVLEEILESTNRLKSLVYYVDKYVWNPFGGEKSVSQFARNSKYKGTSGKISNPNSNVSQFLVYTMC